MCVYLGITREKSAKVVEVGVDSLPPSLLSLLVVLHGSKGSILEERGRILEMMRRREIDLEVEVVADPEMHLRLRSTVVRKRHRFGFWGNE